MADKAWKRIEREKCRALGGERSGPTGRDTPDCSDIHVGLEVKSYKKFVFLTKDWEQAVDNAAKVGLPPVLTVKERGHCGRDEVKMYANDYLAMIDLAGGPTPDYGVEGVCAALFVRLPWPNFVRLYRAAYNKGDQL